jgi:hypothetical protein
MSTSYNLKNIRSLLTEGFSDEDLRRICYDVPDFRPVYNQLARNSSQAEIVDQLIKYAERMLQIELLLTLTKQYNPARYEKHQPYSTTSSDLPGESPKLEDEPVRRSLHDIPKPSSRTRSLLYGLRGRKGGQSTSIFTDPGTPFLITFAEIVERACSELASRGERPWGIGREMFRFYELLARMKKNCTQLRVLIDGNVQSDGEKADIFENPDFQKIVEDQSQTIFALFEGLLLRAHLFEVVIPGFSDHLWRLFNIREGILSSIIYGHSGLDTSVELFVKVDNLAEDAGLEWTPHFKNPILDLNRTYGVENGKFVVVDLNMKDTNAYQYVSKHLKELETALEVAKERLAQLLRDNFNMKELVGEQ